MSLAIKNNPLIDKALQILKIRELNFFMLLSVNYKIWNIQDSQNDASGI